MNNQNKGGGGLVFKIILGVAAFLSVLILTDLRDRQQRTEITVMQMEIQLTRINDKLGISQGKNEVQAKMVVK